MSKKILILFTICLVTCSSFAQKMKVKNQPYGDQRLYHFGFTVGVNMQDLLINNTGYTENGETWFGEIPSYTPGFNVGLIADMYMNPYMNLRFTPTMHFGEKSFTFIEQNTQELYKINTRANYLLFPVDVKFSSMRLNNYRPYFLAGAYGSIDLGRKKGEPLLFETMDYGIQFGLGCDFYLPIVKVCPEIRFYFGLRDILVKDRPDLQDKSLLKYTEAMSRGSTRMFVLTFNFE